MDINTPVERLPRIGNAYKSRLLKLNITTVKELLWHIPFRYEDTSKVSSIKDISTDDNYTIKGRIIEIKNIYTRHSKNITNAIIQDSKGDIADIIWFNQGYLTKNIGIGTEVLLYGKVEYNLYRPKFTSPEYEVLRGAESVHLARITGIYPETKGVSSKWLRYIIKNVLKEASTPLLEDFRKIHFPNNFDEIEQARERLAFEEMLEIQLKIIKRKMEREKREAYPIEIDRKILAKFLSSLPFEMTKDQISAIEDIYKDINKPMPMNRLLEGDVGSGKTVVAAAAAIQVIKQGKKVVFLAPTSILAMQHFLTLSSLISENDIGLLTAKHQKKEDLEKNIIVGTHAVFFKKEDLKDIGLVIIDEQHRFGVQQREELEKLKPYPHILSMSATPIPRTLALALYSDIDLSLIQTKPSIRKDIATYIVPPSKRDASYKFIETAVKERGEQAYVICPLIEESDKIEAKAATLEYEHLKNEVFPNLRVGLLHGQMKAKEKDIILQDFKDRNYDVLVSTSVIEVGIDIPNATIMIIEGAEKFGLAQLHQLRGRVGRSDKQSYCFLFTSAHANTSNERLAMFCKSNDGLKLAEFDLGQRGPGEVYGTRQTGIPSVKVARFNDIELIERAKQRAEEILKIKEE